MLLLSFLLQISSGDVNVTFSSPDFFEDINVTFSSTEYRSVLHLLPSPRYPDATPSFHKELIHAARGGGSWRLPAVSKRTGPYLAKVLGIDPVRPWSFGIKELLKDLKPMITSAPVVLNGGFQKPVDYVFAQL